MPKAPESTYIELHSRRAFSFLRGGSFPEHLVETATELGMPVMALCDRNGVYGAPRFYAKGKESGVRAIVGSELTMEDGSVLPVLVESRAGYQNLCRLLTEGHLRAPKGECAIGWEEVREFAPGLVALTGDEEGPLARSILAHQSGNSSAVTPQQSMERLLSIFGRERLFVEVQRQHLRGEERALRAQRDLAERFNVPLLATS